MAAHSSSSPFKELFVGLYFLFCVTQLFFHVSDGAGFSLELIHRDSPKSPLYDPASTPFSRHRASLHRSASRADYLLRKANSHNSNSSLDDKHIYSFFTKYGEHGTDYVIPLFIASRKNEMLFGFMDTGSELIWVLCHPCHNCYDHINSIFDPTKSKTYHKLHCKSHPCSWLRWHDCNDNNECQFMHEYSDNSGIGGTLSSDLFGLEPFPDEERVGDLYLEKIIFGCTYKTMGDFSKNSIGIIGLSRGHLSLVSQLGHHSYVMRFSYCLPFSVGKSGRLNFGSAAKVSSTRAVTIPLFEYSIFKNLYSLCLNTITVTSAKNQPMTLLHDVKAEGNIVIDTGSPLTYIKGNVMPALIDAVKMHTPYPAVKSMDPLLASNDMFDLCFDISMEPNNPQMPWIIFHFAGGGPLILGIQNAFMKIDATTLCLTILSEDRIGGGSILGSYAQMGRDFVLDLKKNELTIGPLGSC